MNRNKGIDADEIKNVPHRRGDEPAIDVGLADEITCSPQAWG